LVNSASPNFAASVRARLLNVAEALGVDFNQMLVATSTLMRVASAHAV
jgi:hypothetical protein